MMYDYGNFVPGALKTSADKSLLKLGTEMSLFADYGDYQNLAFPSVLAYSHALINGESYTAYRQYVGNMSQETYIMKDIVRVMHGWVCNNMNFQLIFHIG